MFARGGRVALLLLIEPACWQVDAKPWIVPSGVVESQLERRAALRRELPAPLPAPPAVLARAGVGRAEQTLGEFVAGEAGSQLIELVLGHLLRRASVRGGSPHPYGLA